ncbi:hypothetical protein BCR36DRAFT_286490 [Piromyces finnis]|uniref:Chitin-binding type-1 domain-containing protein n=1 Tax=Piromyces finnis TaxID=1754191 RepID=A0A1Y1VDL8_9FUNG|nr:hypothetical protein BCR36DRAFT_286490 [Piromyces finnis]|eukprot:ORX52630.1 hypothetical protein BCR36DRAFT_286490 [Piromyces finnis]
MVYSKNGKYHGCGHLAGNQKCPNNECCSKDGHCGIGSEFCDYGCQPNFGFCN